MAKIWGIAPWQGKTIDGSDTRTVMDQYNADEAASSKEYKNTEEPLGPPTVGPISLDPTDYIGPGALAKAGAAIKGVLTGGFLIPGIIKPVAFLKKHPEFTTTKVVSEDSLPLQVYKGSSVDAGKRSHNAGIWFGDLQTASLYAKGEGANIQPSFLNIQNPTDDLLKWNADVKNGTNLYDGYIGIWGNGQRVYAVKTPKQIASSITGD